MTFQPQNESLHPGELKPLIMLQLKFLQLNSRYARLVGLHNFHDGDYDTSVRRHLGSPYIDVQTCWNFLLVEFIARNLHVVVVLSKTIIATEYIDYIFYDSEIIKI
jgi:hypothetical protein